MKKRLDLLLLERGLAHSEELAQALIMSGNVLVENVPVDKAGMPVNVEANIRIRGEASQFVGRGGDKLLGALEHFALSPQGRTALDVGASTGGFTDCLLQRAAVKVYAVDVGYNQLHDKIRRDKRVVVMEQTHADELTERDFDPLPTFITVDVSFISVKRILESLAKFLPSGAIVLVLVKPQFEVEAKLVEDGGIISSESIQRECVEGVIDFAEKLHFVSRGYVPSVLRGAKKGNQEYFVHFEFRAAAKLEAVS